MAWIERKRSAPSRFAIAVRCSSGMKTSVSRVITTSMPGCFSSSFFSRSDTSSTSSASLMPLPLTPGSWPPWPGSSTMRDTPRPSWRASENCAVGVGQRHGRRRQRCRRNIARGQRSRRYGRWRDDRCSCWRRRCCLRRRGDGNGNLDRFRVELRHARRRDDRRDRRRERHGWRSRGAAAAEIDDHPVRVVEREHAERLDAFGVHHHARRVLRMAPQPDLPHDVVAVASASRREAPASWWRRADRRRAGAGCRAAPAGTATRDRARC